jgi:hypothetical protein
VVVGMVPRLLVMLPLQQQQQVGGLWLQVVVTP